MRTRIQLEDTIQRCVCELLPKMPPQDIRPTYQQQDMAGKVFETDDQNYEYRGFTPNDNFIYIKVQLGNEPIGPYVSMDGSVQITNNVEATFTLYGNQSHQLSLCLFSLLSSQYACQYFEGENLSITGKSDSITEMHEIINEQWFERHEFSLYLQESVNIRTPQNTQISEASSTNIKVIAYEGDNKVGDDSL